jgi:putative membrane protein
VHQFQIEQEEGGTVVVRRPREIPLNRDRARDPSGDERRPGGDERRTSLAGERTVLAWWRTSLTSIAVGVGVGRLLPELAPQATNWPYVVLGVAFTLYGIALFIVGTRRLGILDRHPTDQPGPVSRDWALAALMGIGVLLGVGALIAIVVQ